MDKVQELNAAAERLLRDAKARRIVKDAGAASAALRALARRLPAGSARRDTVNSFRLALCLAELEDMGLTVRAAVDAAAAER